VPFGLACSVARGYGIAQFLEFAVVKFGIVTRRIWLRVISWITIFSKEIAVGDVGVFRGFAGFLCAVNVAYVFEGFVGFAFEEFGIVFVAEFFGGLVAVVSLLA